MAITTTTFSRVRTEVFACIGVTPTAAADEYNAYSELKAADETKTYTVRAVGVFQTDEQYTIVAEASYPEVNLDGTQVPEPVLP